MKDDFEMIERRFDGPITIYPIADVHFGALNHVPEAWEDFCKRLSGEKDSYVILNGDLINNNTRSSVGSPFDDTIRPREQKRAMVEFLSPIKDKILCLTSGNHERRSMKDADDDVTYDIACKLDIEDRYRPNAAFLKIGVGWRTHGKCKPSNLQVYSIAVTHGAGGGIYTGATVNRNERWGNILDGVDCVIVGHTHKGTITRPSKLRVNLNQNKVVSTDFLVISCTPWMRYSDYALQKMLLPSAHSRPQKLLLKEDIKDIEVTW